MLIGRADWGVRFVDRSPLGGFMDLLVGRCPVWCLHRGASFGIGVAYLPLVSWGQRIATKKDSLHAASDATAISFGNGD